MSRILWIPLSAATPTVTQTPQFDTGVFDSTLFGGDSTQFDSAVFDLTLFETDAYYQSSNIQCWNGSAWTPVTLKRWDGEAWVSATLKRWDGATWV